MRDRNSSLPCVPGRSWGVGRCRDDTRGCTCRYCRRRRWCCSASPRPGLELWDVSFVNEPHKHNHKGKTLLTTQPHLALPEWKGNCCLASPVCASQMIVVWKIKKDGQLENSSRWKQNILNYTDDFTLSTPALRIEFPFLFHLSANMGPLCCPKVLARFPNG